MVQIDSNCFNVFEMSAIRLSYEWIQECLNVKALQTQRFEGLYFSRRDNWIVELVFGGSDRHSTN